MQTSKISDMEKQLHDFKGKKFLIGLILFFTNFIVGKLAILILPLSVAIAILVYLCSWLMLFIGLSLCGRQGLAFARVCYYDFRQRVMQNTVRNINSIKKRKRNINDM